VVQKLRSLTVSPFTKTNAYKICIRKKKKKKKKKIRKDDKQLNELLEKTSSGPDVHTAIHARDIFPETTVACEEPMLIASLL